MTESKGHHISMTSRDRASKRNLHFILSMRSILI